MPKVACFMMQKDEVFVLRPWLVYHGHLFGFENLYVLDNGSTLPEVTATLQEFAGKGVNVEWSFNTRQDYLAKSDLIAGWIRVREAQSSYDFLIPLDCDEFIVLRTRQAFECGTAPILNYLATLAGERRILRFPYQLANHPLQPDIYHRYGLFKLFFAAGTVLPIDHGHHAVTDGSNPEILDTRLIHLHFHHKVFDLKLAEARRSWVGTIDPDDRGKLLDYDGPSVHVKEYFLRGKDHYYRGFLDMPHFYLPHFRALLARLDAPLNLPTEPVEDYLRLHVSQVDSRSTSDANGTVVIVPVAAAASKTSPVEFRATRFHEGDYLQANPGLAETGTDPTVHFCNHGFRHDRPSRP